MIVYRTCKQSGQYFKIHQGSRGDNKNVGLKKTDLEIRIGSFYEVNLLPSQFSGWTYFEEHNITFLTNKLMTLFNWKVPYSREEYRQVSMLPNSVSNLAIFISFIRQAFKPLYFLWLSVFWQQHNCFIGNHWGFVFLTSRSLIASRDICCLKASLTTFIFITHFHDLTIRSQNCHLHHLILFIFVLVNCVLIILEGGLYWFPIFISCKETELLKWSKSFLNKQINTKNLSL